MKTFSGLFFCAFVVWGSTAVSEEQNQTRYSSSLEVLEANLHDQAEFERKVRAFDKLHVSLARAKRSEAEDLAEQGQMESAERAVREARELLQMVKTAYELGLSHFEDSAFLNNFYGELLYDHFGRSNEASKHWQRSIHFDSKFSRAHNNLGMHYLHVGMYAIGLDHMDKAIALESKNPDYLFNMVQVYLTHFPQMMQLRKWDKPRIYKEAMKMSRQAVELQPNDYELWTNYALNFFLADRFETKPDWRAAATAWENTRAHARQDDQRFTAWLYEARAHIRDENTSRARTCLEEARKIIPDSPVVKNLLEELSD